jgi:bifunctional DNA-binding transcriptional regulator/antitoxin component of YhaV-PrlF toxin-antitoxin module
MKMSPEGFITIPENIQKFLGISEGSDVDLRIENGKVILDVENAEPNFQLDPNRFEKMRGVWKDGMTTDELMEMTRGKDWKWQP